MPDPSLLGEVQQIDAAPVVAQGDGTIQALGETRWSRADADGGPGRPTFTGRELSVPAGRWILTVDVYPEMLPVVGDRLRDQGFLDRIRVGNESGLPVVTFPPPLRLAGAGDDVGYEMTVTYRHLEVVAGCQRNPETVCSPDGAVSVRGVDSGVELDNVTIVTLP